MYFIVSGKLKVYRQGSNQEVNSCIHVHFHIFGSFTHVLTVLEIFKTVKAKLHVLKRIFFVLKTPLMSNDYGLCLPHVLAFLSTHIYTCTCA